MASKKLNSVQEFYKDKMIFITGGSGFMGKVLIEKLLYSCSDVKELVLLMRPKRGKDEAARIKDFESLPMFERIMKEKPEVMKKIRIVTGEISEPRLGLSEENLSYITENVQIIFHLAASLRLEATLKPNIMMNLTATKKIIDLAKKTKNLLLFMHTSTAFCIIENDIIEETVYYTPHKPADVMRCAEWIDEAVLAKIQPEILGVHSNTYTYTKRLAEILVRDEYNSSNLPMCIVRPSIVGPAYSEPLEGWVDSLNGPPGIVLGASKGVLRYMMVDSKANGNMIPVDVAINAFIMIAKQLGTAKERSRDIPVYNINTHESTLTTYGKFKDVVESMRYEIPPSVALWYPNLTMTQNYWYYIICITLFQWIPAYFIDLLLMIFRQPRFMVRVQKRIAVGMDVLKCFTTNNWIFKTKNFENLVNLQSGEEYKMFFLDTKNIDSVEYYRKSTRGGRRYITKEPDSTIPQGQKLAKILFVIDVVTKIFVYYWLCKIFLDLTGLSKLLIEFVGRIRE